MRRRLSAEALRAKYRDETAHSEHVTALARRLFDATHRHLAIPRGMRRLLEAAGRLHDVGFMLNPADHPRAGAHRVLREGLAGFTAAERRMVASAILEHAGSAALTDRVGSRRTASDSATVLAAYLRVADGLDHSHLQDARIRRVRRTGSAIEVSVAPGVYGGNVRFAEQKADLWNRVFSIPIRLRAAGRPGSRPRPGAGLTRDVSVPEAARRILCLQYRLMDDNRAAIVSGRTDPRHLHDMRVAMNRFRAALRLFRSWLAETSADRLIRELGDFRRKIASARDSQVWTRILRSRPVLRRLRRTPDGKAHLRAQEREGRRQAACLKRALESRTYAGLKSDMARLARIEVRGPAVMGDARLFRAHVARKLMRTYRRLIRERPPGGGGSIAELHALRKRCRRARYWAELGAPVLGSVGPKLVRRLKRVTDALGDLHDIDIRRGRREDDASPMPGSLAALLKKRRAVAAKDFEKAWRALREKTFRRHLMKVLRAARKSD